EFRGHKDNEEDKLRKVVDIRSKEIKRAIDITHVVPNPSPIIPFKPKTETIETNSIVPPEFFSSVDEAKTFIFMNTGVGFDEMDVKLKDAIEKSLENIYGALGKIDSNFVLLCVNKIQESKNGNVYQHASN
ncbi:MAG: hypothetical protein N3A69_16200, partial [Leptospiraceae bacterium]|nr:hypothetical protein [Leptospiraceae bacterium]